MILSPTEFRCQKHRVDLTDLVREQLEYDFESDPYFIAHYDSPSVESVAKHFVVVVTCPGDDGPHSLKCKGKFYL